MSKETQKTYPIGIFLMLLASLSTALGQLFWKMASSLFDWELWIGFFLYGCGAILMSIAFRYGRLSVLHPLLTVGYVFAIIFGFIFLGEEITRNILFGTACILIGVLLIGGDRH